MKVKTIADVWKSMLPQDVWISCGEIENNLPSLSLSEQMSIGNVSNFRLHEFDCGRMHARNALKQMGIFNSEIPKNMQTGAPIWPESVVGSITHSHNANKSHVAAIVANASHFSCLGIDTEWIDNFHPSIWSQFLTTLEVRMIQNVSVKERNAYVCKLWALKEAAIKALGNGDMLNWCVFKSEDGESFELVNSFINENMALKGRSVVFQGMVLAVVYSYANKRLV